MWENTEFNIELLQDAVIELENEKALLKKILKERENSIVRLKDQLSKYKFRSDISSTGNIYTEPTTVTLPILAVVSLAKVGRDEEYHVVGRQVDSDKIVFSYNANIPNKISPKQKLGILAYLHKRVMEELQKNIT